MTNNRRGQSLIEAIIAISLLTVGFIGIAALLSRSLFLTKVVADQTKATYLAAEGIELAKNLIDHDVYSRLAGQPVPWGNCFTAGQIDLELDYTSTDCGKSYFSTDVLRFDPVTGLYSYAPPVADNPVATGFTREIRAALAGSEITITSRVRWSTGPLTQQSITLEDRFYNWHP